MSKIDVSNMDLYYGDFHALKNINLSIDVNEVTAFIGPSGCGKSTLLKSINRMNDLVPAAGSPVKCCWTEKTSTAEKWMSTDSANGSAWYFRNQIRSR